MINLILALIFLISSIKPNNAAIPPPTPSSKNRLSDNSRYPQIKNIANINNIENILDDLTTLTEYVPADWICKYGKEEFPFSTETIKKYVPLSPKVYRSMKDGELNKLRAIAGVKVPELKEIAQDVRDYVNLSTKR